MSERVPSPCVSHCALTEDARYCQGCYRTPDEIAAWMTLDDDQRRDVLDACEDRRARSSPPLAPEPDRG